MTIINIVCLTKLSSLVTLHFVNLLKSQHSLRFWQVNNSGVTVISSAQGGP